MHVGAVCDEATYGAKAEVVGPLSLLASICRGLTLCNSNSGNVCGSSGSGTGANIFDIGVGWCGARRSVTRFS